MLTKEEIGIERLIYVKRTRPFIHDQLTSEAAQEELSHSKRGVGSYFAGRFSDKKGTGLSTKELHILMPKLLDSAPIDPDFHKKIKEFYMDIYTEIPYGDKGKQLNIALLDVTTNKVVEETIEEIKAGKSKLTETVLPVDIEDYVRFRHILFYPNTAKSYEAAVGDPTVEFYILDPKVESLNKVASLDAVDTAQADYLIVSKDVDKVKMILTLMKHLFPKEKDKLGKPVIYNIDSMSFADQRVLLRKLADKQPEQFHSIATDKKLIYKYRVEELLINGLLTRVGTTIMTTDGVTLGESLTQAAVQLFSAKHTQLLNELKVLYNQKKGITTPEEKVEA